MRFLISFILILTISLFTACESKDESKAAFSIDRAVKLSVKNHEGEDLLDPSNSNSYTEEDITVFYLVDGEKKKVFRPNLEISKGFKIYNWENTPGYRMTIFPNDLSEDDIRTTYIQWSKNDLDTMKTKIERRENMVWCRKVWWNGEVRWDAYPKKTEKRLLEINK
jgi:hypothetical protein